ncbi:MAG: ribonuclease J [Proteobacteria bacterium]|nr:ribonuclease J [Pseudomonadota bacterium]
MNDVKITPLGGLGEIGLNMMELETQGESVIIDCGLMFPEPHMPGIDIVIPGFDHIRTGPARLKGLVLTHGHEDHIGALPFFLKEFKVPVYGTALTLGLLEKKLKEHDLLNKVERITVRPGATAPVGPFKIKFIHVCHSIPDGCALAIGSPQGTIVHSGDFRFEDNPADGIKTDIAGLEEEGKKGIRLLLSDSTNVETPGRTESEKKLGPFFKKQFLSAKRKVFISLFSSNINRIQQIIDAAEEAKRKIVLVGRSLVSNIEIAREKGYLSVESSTIIGIKGMAAYPPGQIAIITTGSQGEPMSGLSLMATKSHKYVSVDEGDVVVLSSKSIPGNEKLICKIINQLIRSGAEVLYEKIADVHVSGHACREELEDMIRLTRPEHFIPIHGEHRHLKLHRRLAVDMGIPAEKTLIMENGNTVVISDDGISMGAKVPTGRVFIDGKGVGDIKDLVLRDRLHLSRNGMVVAVISISKVSGDNLNSVEIFTKGCISEEDGEDLLKGAKKALLQYISDACEELKGDWTEMEAESGKVLKRFFKKQTGKRPVIIPVIVELG